TYHKYQDKLRCHYCGQQYPPVHICPACGSNKIAARSFGTEKIEDDIRKVFPKAAVARMDFDAVKSKEGHNKLIALFEQRRVDILVGTQMIVKGLDFEHVNLVGILNADNLLNYPDFRVNERAFQLMEQVSGRSGRKEEQGLVVIQAANLKHPVLQYVKDHDYNAMYEMEISQRGQFGYPPFYRLVKITLKHKKQNTVIRAAEQLATQLRPVLKKFIVGPAAPLIGRLRNYYLMELLVKLPRDTHQITRIKDLLKEQFAKLQTDKQFRSVIIIPDVDCN
ncbi:MAG TPA: primosomal protein N', partial [Chitinophagaceae bacterium]